MGGNPERVFTLQNNMESKHSAQRRCGMTLASEPLGMCVPSAFCSCAFTDHACLCHVCMLLRVAPSSLPLLLWCWCRCLCYQVWFGQLFLMSGNAQNFPIEISGDGSLALHHFGLPKVSQESLLSESQENYRKHDFPNFSM